jgi:AcrR family transcriptional regulator
MGPRSASAEHTRKKILHQAHQLFVEHGFHGTSMRRIAREAGVALGNLYNHFQGKEDLFTSVLFEFHPYHQILPVLQAAHGDTMEDFARSAAALMVDHLGAHPEFLNLMFIELVELDGRHMPDLVGLILPQLISTIEPFTQRGAPRAGPAVPTRGQRLRPIPGPLLFRAFIGLFFSYYITDMFFSRMASDQQPPGGLDTFVDIFLHGVLEPVEG